MTNRVDLPDKSVKDALERALRSREFAASPRMQKLLEFIVLEAMNGRTDTLKGHAIGVKVFGRDVKFDPDGDSIVRVQMGRLRKSLAHYYLADGKNDPVHIRIPKGRYAPQFIIPEPELPTAAATKTKNAKPAARYLIAGAVSALVLLAGFAAYLAFAPAQAPGPAPEREVRKLSDIVNGPVVAVFPYRNLSAKAENTYLQRGLAIELISDLSRFKNLSVLSQDTTVYNSRYREHPQEAGRRIGVQYIVTGSYVLEDNLLRVTAQLQESPSGRIIWSNTYKRHLLSESVFDVQARIVRAVASKLGQPYGIINRHSRHSLLRNGIYAPNAYICVLSFYDYAHEENAANHLKTRKCLEQAIKDRPDYAQAYAALSWMYVDEYRQGFNPRLDAAPPLDRALEMARKAVVLDPDDAFTHRRLANVFAIRGAMELARDEIMKALELNPNNSEVLADVGWIVKNLGDWFTAFFYASKAIALNPGFPPWYLETPFLYHYANQDCRNSLKTANSFYRQDSSILLPHVFMVVAARLCQVEPPGISRHIEAINTSYPDFLRSPGKTLSDMSVPLDLIPLMLDALLESGIRLGRQKGRSG